MITIGIDASNLRDGGGVTHIVEVLGNLSPEDHGIGRVVVWAPKATAAQIATRPWLDVRSPAVLERGAVRRLAWQHFRLAALVKEAGCDILFSPGGTYTGNFQPRVTMCRNMEPFEPTEIERAGHSKARLRLEALRWLQIYSFRRSTALIFLTKYAKETVSHAMGCTRGRVDIIAHGVRSHSDLPISPERKANGIVYVSRVSPYKHQWNVIEATKIARRRTGLPLELLLIGPSSSEASTTRLENAIRQADPKGAWVHYIGAKSRSEIERHYAEHAIGVFASSCENMPNILLEMMAAKLAIGCSNRGPMPEILGNGGVYFDPENVDSIAGAIECLAIDGALREQLSERASVLAAGYNWQVCSERTFRLVSEVARASRGA